MGKNLSFLKRKVVKFEKIGFWHKKWKFGTENEIVEKENETKYTKEKVEFKIFLDYGTKNKILGRKKEIIKMENGIIGMKNECFVTENAINTLHNRLVELEIYLWGLGQIMNPWDKKGKFWYRKWKLYENERQIELKEMQQHIHVPLLGQRPPDLNCFHPREYTFFNSMLIALLRGGRSLDSLNSGLDFIWCVCIE